MFLDSMRKVRQAGRSLCAAASLAVVAVGCTSGPEEMRNSRVANQRLDTLEKCREKLAKSDSLSVARSQSPPNNPPTITPVTSVTMDPSAAPAFQGDAQVRIVATIGTTPIYEREVREAVYQRLPEIINLPAADRRAKEKEMFNEELRRIVERELILDELFAVLTQKKQTASLNQLKDSAAKDAEQRIRDIQKRAKIPNEDELKSFFQSQGLTVTGVKRHFERSFMMSAYLGERLRPKVNGISLIDIRDYYEEHGDEFKTDDKVKWQDIFIRVDRFRSKADAKKYAEWLLNRAVQGEDFVKLVNEFDHGDSKLRGGFGFGEERGKIFPADLEATVFSLKQGQATLVDFETGYHIIRIAERSLAGKKPFDEQVQLEIRRKLQGIVNEREYRKVVDTLWRRSQPQILVD
jgi:parvulin-like peptidyl-prolyl isomerase